MKINVTIKKNQHAYECEALWYPKYRILDISLISASPYSGYNSVILAANVEQIIFSTTPEHEVISIESIGAKFNVDKKLKHPQSYSHGNIILNKKTNNISNSEYSISKDNGHLFDFGNRDLIFSANLERTVFLIRIEQDVPTKFISPSPSLIYGICNESLSSIYILNPKRSRMY